MSGSPKARRTWPLGADLKAVAKAAEEAWHATPRDAMVGGWPHPLSLTVLGACTLACSVAAARLLRWE